MQRRLIRLIKSAAQLLFVWGLLVAASTWSGSALETENAREDGSRNALVRWAGHHHIVTKNRHTMVDGLAFTGMLIEVNLSNVTVKTTYQNGIKNGIEEGYYANGSLAYSRSWKAGLREGMYSSWWPNKSPKLISFYSKDVFEGRLSEWFETGVQARSFTYKAGQEEGHQRMWYQDGTQRANYVVKNGRRYGSIGTKGCGTDESEGQTPNEKASNE